MILKKYTLILLSKTLNTKLFSDFFIYHTFYTLSHVNNTYKIVQNCMQYYDLFLKNH